ncbi:MAG: hypothetical protein H5U27_11940 [Methyloversatilis sp.]|nr:hypothetical protein [Methyloversatilis sp.]
MGSHLLATMRNPISPDCLTVAMRARAGRQFLVIGVADRSGQRALLTVVMLRGRASMLAALPSM